MSMTFHLHRHPDPASDERRAEIHANPGFGQYFTDHMVTAVWTKGGGWQDAAISPYGPITLMPSAAVLHYAQAIFDGLKAHDNPWAQPKTQRGHWSDGLGLGKLGDGTAATLLFAGCSADRPDGKAGAVALARLMQRAGVQFAVLGAEEKNAKSFTKGMTACPQASTSSTISQCSTSASSRTPAPSS